MKTAHTSIWKNSLFVLFTQVIRLLTNFVIFIGIARLYGPESFGQFTIAYTVATICIVIADFGFDVLLTTEIASAPQDAAQIGRKFFSMKIIFAAVSAMIMLLIPSFKAFSENSRMLIYALTLYVVFTTLANFFYAIFRGFEKFEYETKISFVTNFLLLLLLGIFGYFQAPLLQLMIIFVAARFFAVVLSAYQTHSLIGENILKFEFEGWRKILSPILVFGIHFIFGNLFFQLDTILIGLWQGDHAVGMYQAAFKLMILLLLVPEIAIKTLLPVLSRLFTSDSEGWTSLSKLLYKILMLTALPVSLILYFYSDWIISILYGAEEFSEAVPILKIFAVIVLIRFAAEPFALMLTTSKRQHVRMVIVIVATVISFVSNYFIIPIYGIHGAALVSLGVNVLVAAGYVIANNSFFIKWNFEFRQFVMLVIIVLISLLLFHIGAELILLPVIILVYFPAAYFIGFTNEDREMLFANFKLKGIKINR